MKSFGIEYKFIADDAEHVTEHRRFVTPWFYLRLKDFEYCWLNELHYVFGIPCRFKGWKNKTKGTCLSLSFDLKKIEQIENAASEFKPTNIVSFKR